MDPAPALVMQYALSYVTFPALWAHTGDVLTLIHPCQAEMTDDSTEGAFGSCIHPFSGAIALLVGAHVLDEGSKAT